MLVEAVLLSGLTMADVKYLQMLAICFCYVFLGAFFRMADQSCSPVLLTSNGLGPKSPKKSKKDIYIVIYKHALFPTASIR